MMLSFTSFAALAAALFLVFENAVPASARRLSARDYNIENSYIVKLKAGANTTSHINSLSFSFSVEDENSPVTHWWPDFFKGYSGIFVGADLDAILASPDVEYVEKNGIVSADVSQRYEPWNLQAISTRVPVGGTDVKAMKYTYSYAQPIGEGVDIYVLDTGVYIEHNEFDGRARFGWAVRGHTNVDSNGHGTHVAGIAVGKTYGVAKKANIIAVKVLDDYGRGTTANSIEGLNWVDTNVRSTGRPSIACAAFSDEYNQGVNDAATALVAGGVTVITGAGNKGEDGANRSPASATNVITVGASNITNHRPPQSNFGAVVDVFAPGDRITSAWIGAPWNFAHGSGTSQACAHVAGIAAYLLSMNPTMTPAAIRTRIKSLATPNAISNVPDGTTRDLVFNGGFPLPPL